MAEVSKQITPYQVDYQCDSCKSENVILDPSSSNISPRTYVCPNCNFSIQLDTLYPYIEYK